MHDVVSFFLFFSIAGSGRTKTVTSCSIKSVRISNILPFLPYLIILLSLLLFLAISSVDLCQQVICFFGIFWRHLVSQKDTHGARSPGNSAQIKPSDHDNVAHIKSILDIK